MIRPPQIPGRHISSILNRLALTANLPSTVVPSTSEESSSSSESSTGEPSQTKSSPVIAHGTYIKPKREPVIACGTYNPNVSRQSYDPAIAYESGTSGTAHENEAWGLPVFPYGTNSHSGHGYKHNPQGTHGNPVRYQDSGLNTASHPINDTQPSGLPAPGNINTVTLSDMHPKVRMLEIKRLVERVAKARGINMMNIWFLDGTTIGAKYKEDAEALKFVLTGRRLSGVKITATLGTRVLE